MNDIELVVEPLALLGSRVRVPLREPVLAQLAEEPARAAALSRRQQVDASLRELELEIPGWLSLDADVGWPMRWYRRRSRQ